MPLIVLLNQSEYLQFYFSVWGSFFTVNPVFSLIMSPKKRKEVKETGTINIDGTSWPSHDICKILSILAPIQQNT